VEAQKTGLSRPCAPDEMTDQPLFAKRIPFTQLVLSQHNAHRDRLVSTLYPGLQHYHNMMVLAAGIVGIVVPALHTQGPALINSWFLKRTAISMGILIVLGAIISGVSRWIAIRIISLLEHEFAGEMDAIRSGDDEESISAALDARNNDPANTIAKQAMAWYRGTVWLGAIGDFFFYGAFVWGVLYLIRGFIRS
jgi:hypothetical protein